MKLSILWVAAGLSALACTAPVPAAGEEVAAKIGGKVITRAELNEKAAAGLAKVREDEYKILRGALDDMINEQLIAAAAQKAGKTAEQLEQEEITSKVTEPTEAEISTFYEQVKARAGGQTLEQLKPRLIEALKSQQGGKLYGELVDRLRKEAGVTILLDPPRAVVSVDDDPAEGPVEAPITIVAFSDYQCPYCKRAEPTIKEVMAKYPGKVKYVFRDYPLSFHQNAQKAGEAAGCAMEQGKFWEMHAKLFENNGALQVENLKKYAQEIGLDAAKFGQCLDSGQRASEVTADMNSGIAVGVNSTPAFFINGRLINGAMPLEAFSEIIDEELARAQATAGSDKKDSKKKG